MRLVFSRVPAVLAMSYLLILGCRKEDVRVYQAPKDLETPPSSSPSPASVPSEREVASSDSKPKGPPWTVPSGWVEQATSGMRVASYSVKTIEGRAADISVVALEGEAGGELSNVNRWREQIGLGAVTEEQLPGLRTVVPAGGRQVVFYEIAGKKLVLDGKYKARTLASILPAGAMTVFFKMTGEEALVASEKTKFLAWIRSVETGDGPHESEVETPVAASKASSTTATQAPLASTDSSVLPHWSVPSGWKDGGSRPMRLASFEISDAEGIGDVSISSLSGDGGGLLANVNRWRGQAGLAAVDEATLKRESGTIRTADGETGFLVDLKGTEKRILAVIIPHGGSSWFIKLTAPTGLIAKERSKFDAFVQSIRF
ncbi:MAG: hypothetical protein EXS25_05770 [Pedosphaera sp.]|nr:hypothetical protein [Pedosphaera sp.]